MPDFTELSTSPAAALDWWKGWMDWMSQASRLAQGAGGRLAPDSLNQPILPGWTFGNSIVVNETNSSSPETERRIVSRESYGRQLGRILDALTVMIEASPPHLKADPALRDVVELRKRIEAIKAEALQDRVQRLAGELAALKREHEPEFRKVMEQVAG